MVAKNPLIYKNKLPGATRLMPQTHKELQDEEDAEYVSEYYRLMIEGKVLCLKTRPLLVA